jgi:hypothetical protein
MMNDEFDEAVKSLEQAYLEVGTPLAWQMVLPVFDAMRDSDKFKALYEKIGYPCMVRLHDWNIAINGPGLPSSGDRSGT